MEKILPIVAVVIVVALVGTLLVMRRPSAEVKEYDVEDVVVYPPDVPEGGKVYITLLVTSRKVGSVDVEINVEGEPLSQEVEVENVGQRFFVTFTYVPSVKAGSTLRITAGEIRREIQVREPKPAEFRVTRISAPAQALLGREVEVLAEIKNEGERENLYTGRVRIGDRVVKENPPVRIGPMETRLVSFKFSIPADLGEGTKTLTVVADREMSTTVLLQAPRVVLENVLTVPSTVYEGDAEVELKITNRGNDRGTVVPVVTYRKEGETESKQARGSQVTVLPGETKVVPLKVSLTSGTYTFQAPGDVPRSMTVLPKPDVWVEEIVVPSVVVVGSQVEVTLKLKSGANGGSFSETLTVKVEDQQIFSQSISEALAPNAEKSVKTRSFAVERKGVCTVEIKGKSKSFRSIGYNELFAPGDWMKYSYSSVIAVPELNQRIENKGTFTYTFAGTEMVEGRQCRKMVREFGPGSYDVLYAPDTEREAYIYQAYSYRGGALTSELKYSEPLKVFSFPLTAGAESSGRARAIILNYQPVALKVEGDCVSEAKVEGVETKTVKGKSVEAVKISITLKVTGTATIPMLGQQGPVTSETKITRYVSRSGVLIEETAVTSSKVTLQQGTFTFINEERMQLTDFNLSVATL